MPKAGKKQSFLILLSLTVIILIGFITYTISLNAKEKALKAQKEQLLNEQKFATFRDGLFRIDYPYWPDMDRKKLLDTTTVKKAVNNDNCSLIISKNDLAKNTTFGEYVEGALNRQLTAYEKVKFLQKEIGDKSASFVVELTTSGVTLYSYSKSFLSSRNQVYSVAFIAPKGNFDLSCSPFLEKTFNSVLIN